MRLAKFFCLAALVAMSAVVVQAGSINSGGDPAFTINKCTKGCDLTDFGFAPGFLGLSQNNPLIINYTTLGTFNFEYTGPGITLTDPGTQLWVQFDMVPGPPFPKFNCVSSSSFTCDGGTLGNVADSLVFAFIGGPLTTDEIISVEVAPTINDLGKAPEPSTMLLFLSLCPAIGFAKKRWNSRQSA